MVLGADFVGAVELSMEVKEVDNHAFHGVSECVVPEEVAYLRYSSLDCLKVVLADCLLFGREWYYGVLEE